MSLSDFGVRVSCESASQKKIEKIEKEREREGRGKTTVRCVCSFYGKRNCRSFTAPHSVWELTGCEMVLYDIVENCESNS